MDAALCLRTSWNSYLVVSLSPVAIGMLVLEATSAIASGWPGGTGSSNQRGSKGSNRLARRMADAGVIWPWVPNNKSQRSPTASRIFLQKVSHLDKLESDIWWPE